MRVFIPLLLAVTGIAAAESNDTATTIRNTVLRQEPAQSSAVVTELQANTELRVFERERVWVRVVPSSDESADPGWLRFTELKFGVSAPAAEVPADVASPGGFAGFSRSVSGFLRGFRSRSPSSPQATATIGVRGLTVADLEAANPDPASLALINRYLTSRDDAARFAAVGGLAARPVSEGTPQP